MEDIIKIEKYISWCNDDIDRIIHETFFKHENVEITFTVLINIIYTEMIKKIAGESLNQRLDRLMKEGILESKNKESNIKLFKKKNEK